MQLLLDAPYFFDELANDDIALLDSYIENNLMLELKVFFDLVVVKFENRTLDNKIEFGQILEAFHFNLTLESMRRRGLVSISERVYILDRKTLNYGLTLGPKFRG